MAVTVNTVPVHATKMYWGEEVGLHLFSDSSLDGGEWPTLKKYFFTSGESTAGVH